MYPAHPSNSGRHHTARSRRADFGLSTARARSERQVISSSGLSAEPALSAFLAGCLLAGALGIVVGWALARAVGLIDGAP
jgi:hypothetical protein